MKQKQQQFECAKRKVSTTIKQQMTSFAKIMKVPRISVVLARLLLPWFHLDWPEWGLLHSSAFLGMASGESNKTEQEKNITKAQKDNTATLVPHSPVSWHSLHCSETSKESCHQTWGVLSLHRDNTCTSPPCISGTGQTRQTPTHTTHTHTHTHKHTCYLHINTHSREHLFSM